MPALLSSISSLCIQSRGLAANHILKKEIVLGILIPPMFLLGPLPFLLFHHEFDANSVDLDLLK